MTASATTWECVLDAYEARLDEQRAALDRGDVGPPAPFCPPTDLGSLPNALLTRARELLRRSLDLELELADNVHVLAHDLALVRAVGASTSRPPHPLFVDLSA